MAFFLFILVNAVIFIRPSEWYGPILAWPVYQWAITACLIFSWPMLLKQLSIESLRNNPITVSVLGIFVTVCFSLMWNFAGVNEFAYEFVKVTTYYLLVVGLIDSKATMNRFLRWLAIIITATAMISLMDYHGVLDAGVKILNTTTYDSVSGTASNVDRVSGPGKYFDPNDFAVFLIIGMVLCVHSFHVSPTRIVRFGWFVPLGFVGYATWLTQSRGGYLALIVTIAGWAYAKWGLRKAAVTATLLLPVLFMAFEGRMTEIELGEGTGQLRIQLWNDTLVLIKQNPVFGIGPGQIDTYLGHATHNAFLNIYADIGLVGGTFFVGAFFCALITTWHLRSDAALKDSVLNENIVPTMFAVTIGFIVGNLALSQHYTLTTYLVLGLAAACCRIYRPQIERAYATCDSALLVRFSVASVSFLVASHIFVRLSVNW